MLRFAFLLVVCLAASCKPSGDLDKIVALRHRIELNPHDSEALDRLLEYLGSDHWLDPKNAAGCFRQLAEGPKNKSDIVPVIAPRVVPALVKHAEHVGRAATSALTEYGQYVLPYKQELVAIIRKYPTQDIGWFAAASLGNLGRDAKDTLGVIEAMPVFDTNREIIREAIRKIRDAE